MRSSTPMPAFDIPPHWSSIPVLGLGVLAWTVLNRRLWVRGPASKPVWNGPGPEVGLFVIGAHFVTLALVASTPGSRHLGTAVVGLVTIVASLAFWKSMTGHYPFTDKAPVLDVAKGLVHVATLFPLMMVAAAVNRLFLENPDELHPVINEILSSDPGALAFLGYVGLVVIIAPVVEEILYRGFLQASTEKFLGFLPAMLVQCAFFTMLHPAYSRLPLFVFAIGLTLVTRWSSTLLPAIVMHAAFNGLNMLELSITKYGPWWEGLLSA